MKRLVGAFFIALLPLTNLNYKHNDSDGGSFTIEPKNRINNIEPGYCAWCSIEMIGRQRNIKPLIGLARKRVTDDDLTIIHNGRWFFPKNVGTEVAIQIKLRELGIKWKMQWNGQRDTDLIEYAIKNKLGCVIAFHPGTLVPESHAVVLTKYSNNSVEIVDPNFIAATITLDRKWFDWAWNGFILVIDKQ